MDTCFLPGRDYQWNFDTTGGGSLSNRDLGAVINCGDPGDDSFIDNIKYSFPANHFNFLKPTSFPLRDQTGLAWTLVTNVEDISGPISVVLLHLLLLHLLLLYLLLLYLLLQVLATPKHQPYVLERTVE